MLLIRGKTISLKPLGFREMKSVARHIQAFMCRPAETALFDEENSKHLLAIIHAAVRREVKNVTLEEVEEALNIQNLETVVATVLGTNQATLRA
ncbi:hypothetical protein [Rhodanobacter sp. DHB23]|uniref:hypothetical protein n=1 Tax=Rhodanobacter sp. DHB23 TaxID=2775923 RepID=UPI00177C691C|nr:hypothetical protein [Rhodanobacter sp. DHB23]MBD8873843.1 hypothetical protein [Rhodanobacter sp. DHB23]